MWNGGKEECDRGIAHRARGEQESEPADIILTDGENEVYCPLYSSKLLCTCSVIATFRVHCYTSLLVLQYFFIVFYVSIFIKHSMVNLKGH